MTYNKEKINKFIISAKIFKNYIFNDIPTATLRLVIHSNLYY